MKFRKEFGSEAVRDLIREAQARAATSPEKTVRDPWPVDRLWEIAEVDLDPKQQDK
jgi:hypothetical protein